MPLDYRRMLVNTALAATLATLLALFMWQARHYATYTSTLATESGMLDLTQSALADGNTNAFIALSRDAACAPDAFDCWLSPNFNPARHGFMAVTLPRFNLRQHPLYAATVGQGSVRYLVMIDIPVAWRGQALAFSPRYVGHRDFAVWVNGAQTMKVADGGQNDSLTVDLPPNVTKLARVVVAIEGRLTAADEGVFHRSSLFVGPQTAVHQLAVAKIYGMENYYLLFLVGKGAIFLVFAMLFIAGGSDYRLGHFLVYALSVTVENLLIGDFLPPAFDLPLRVALCFPLKILGIAALAAFFAGKGRYPSLVWRAGATATFVTVLAAADYAYGTKTVTIQWLFAWVNAAMMTAVAGGLIAAWHRRERRTAGVLAVYLGLLAHEYLIRRFDGFDYRAIYDVGLFLFVAWLGALSVRAKNSLIDRQNAEIASNRLHAVIAQTSQMLAHDVRKPLNLIELTANAVAGETDPVRAAAILNAGLPAVKRAKAAADAMIADIMAIGSAIRIDSEPVNVAGAIKLVLEDAQLPASLRIEVDCPANATIYADRNKFHRVLTNLIDNAATASGPRGTIAIRANQVDDLIGVRVFNSGSYLTPLQRQKIFEPFVSTKPQGTGLGLTIVRRLVEAHGGRVNCLSEKNVGTTFDLLWPAARRTSAGLNIDFDVLFGILGKTKHPGLAK